MVIDLLFILKSTEGRHSGFHGLNSVARTEKIVPILQLNSDWFCYLNA